MNERSSVLSLEQKILPIMPTWKKRACTCTPDDLSKFATHGDSLYGFEKESRHPIAGAPLKTAEGGVVYFGAHVKPGSIQSLFSLCDVQKERRSYACFFQVSRDVPRDRFLRQLRIVSYAALASYFFAITQDEYDCLPDQPLTIAELLSAFIKEETEMRTVNNLAGSAGGDGHMTSEMLGFGFMVENTFCGIYRIWSRPWLLTK